MEASNLENYEEQMTFVELRRIEAVTHEDTGEQWEAQWDEQEFLLRNDRGRTVFKCATVDAVVHIDLMFLVQNHLVFSSDERESLVFDCTPQAARDLWELVKIGLRSKPGYSGKLKRGAMITCVVCLVSLLLPLIALFVVASKIRLAKVFEAIRDVKIISIPLLCLLFAYVVTALGFFINGVRKFLKVGRLETLLGPDGETEALRRPR
jgi:hypothetical protein